MKLNELEQFKKAPDRGCFLAYTRKAVVFEKYGNKEEVRDKLGEEELLELHLFDNEKEYRAIATSSKRIFQNSAKKTIECVIAPDPQKRCETYEETVLIEDKFRETGRKMTIVNYLMYDENGMIRIDNYRLKMGEAQDGV